MREDICWLLKGIPTEPEGTLRWWQNFREGITHQIKWRVGSGHSHGIEKKQQNNLLTLKMQEFHGTLSLSLHCTIQYPNELQGKLRPHKHQVKRGNVN